MTSVRVTLSGEGNVNSGSGHSSYGRAIRTTRGSNSQPLSARPLAPSGWVVRLQPRGPPLESHLPPTRSPRWWQTGPAGGLPLPPRFCPLPGSTHSPEQDTVRTCVQAHPFLAQWPAPAHSSGDCPSRGQRLKAVKRGRQQSC